MHHESLEPGNFNWNGITVVVLITTKFSMSTFSTCIEDTSIYKNKTYIYTHTYTHTHIHTYIEYTWIKAHARHEGNKLADKLAKEATRGSEICYNKIPKSETEHQEKQISTEKWQQLWDNTTKGTVTKEFFPKIKDRLNIKITLTPNFTAMVTAHGKTRSYLHRFKIIELPECPCGNGTQTVEHLLQWNLDLSFFKGTEKTNDECGQTINPENYYTM